MWVVDLERGTRWWCNRAGLAAWNAASLEEWFARNAMSSISEATRTRLQTMRARFERGETATERWTFYPDGRGPMVAECMVSGILVAEARGEAGRMAMLVEARELRGGEVDPSERRGYEAMRYLGELVSYYDDSGAALMRNPAATRALGDVGAGDLLLAGFVDPGQVAALRGCLAGGAVWRADVLARTMHGEQWFDTEARASLDPVTGKLGVLVTQRDITEQRAHVEALGRQSELLAAQAEALRHLAAPVMRVGVGVLALPLIGTLDRSRVEAALAALLAGAGQEGVRRVVLDLTGAAEVDLAAADGLLRIVRVLQLQGISTAISGVRPALAQAMVRAGLEPGGVRWFQSMADALRG